MTVGVLVSLLVQAACSSASETGVDEPADAAPPAVASHLWSRGFGGRGIDSVWAVAVDGEGEITTIGDFSRTAQFGGPSFVAEDHDVFIAHYTPDGEHIWSRAAGGDYFNFGCSVTSMSDGSVIVTADGAPGIDLGGGALTSGETIVAKLSRADGSHIWSKDFPDASTYGCSHVAAVDGGIVIAGTTSGATDFGGGSLEPIGPGGSDVYTVKLSADGDHLWSRLFGGPDTHYARGIAAAGPGELVVVGTFKGTTTFGADTLVSRGGYDGFVTLFDADTGEPRWSRQLGGPMSDFVWDVSANESLVAVAGQFTDTSVFSDTTSLKGTAKYKSDAFVAVYQTATGEFLWAHALGNELYNDDAFGVHVDASGILIAGTVDWLPPQDIDTDIGGPPHIFAAMPFVAAYALDGRLTGYQHFDQDDGEVWGRWNNEGGAFALAVEPSGDFVMAGTFSGDISLGGALLENHGSRRGRDVFVGKFSRITPE